MTVEQAADYTGFPRFTIYKRVSQKTIPHLKVGRRVMFDVKELDLWMSKFKVPAESPQP